MKTNLSLLFFTEVFFSLLAPLVDKDASWRKFPYTSAGADTKLLSEQGEVTKNHSSLSLNKHILPLRRLSSWAHCYTNCSYVVLAWFEQNSCKCGTTAFHRMYLQQMKFVKKNTFWLALACLWLRALVVLCCVTYPTEYKTSVLIQKLTWRVKSQHICMWWLLAVKNKLQKPKPSDSYYLNKAHGEGSLALEGGNYKPIYREI